MILMEFGACSVYNLEKDYGVECINSIPPFKEQKNIGALQLTEIDFSANKRKFSVLSIFSFVNSHHPVNFFSTNRRKCPFRPTK